MGAEGKGSEGRGKEERIGNGGGRRERKRKEERRSGGVSLDMLFRGLFIASSPKSYFM